MKNCPKKHEVFRRAQGFAKLETIEFTRVRVPIAPPRSLQNVAHSRSLLTSLIEILD